MTALKKISALAVLLTCFASVSYSQEYYDSDKRYMKLTEVSTGQNYGFEIESPIKVGADEHAIGAYLNSLKTPDGDRIHVGGMAFNYKKKLGLVMVILTFELKKDSLPVYFLITTFEQPKAIVGFSFKTMDDVPKAVVFPADSIVKAVACSEKIYAVNDFLVKEKFGELDKPSSNPVFSGGIDELKKYFASDSLTDEKVKEMMFNVSIAFLVNCEGVAGDFVIVTKGRGELATYANQVLAIVNKMPQKWQPAKVHGKSVDCYQILMFTIVGGQLKFVSYR